MPRLKSSLIVAAITKIVSGKNGAAYITKRGAEDAGAIFITLYERNSRTYILYEPTPQVMFSEAELDRDNRAFSLVSKNQNEIQLNERFDSEAKFDPDFWIVEVEGVDQEDLEEAVIIL